MQIAFLGLGLMGGPMARNIAARGFAVTAWNRTPGKADWLKAHGVKLAATAEEAVTHADIIITMVNDGPAVENLVFATGLDAHLKSGAIVIDMSSIKPAEARDHAARLAARGVHHLDCPVSGGTKGAEAATLAIMGGGDAAIFDRARPVLEAMGRPVLVGPSGAGQLSKLANQGIVAITIGAVAEAIALIEAGGADPEKFRLALKGGFADSTILQQHGARMQARDFAPGGRSAFQLKDLVNLTGEAQHLGLDLPLAEILKTRFARLVTELDGADLDHSALFLELLDLNGRV